jgi:hypothetical protein
MKSTSGSKQPGIGPDVQEMERFSTALARETVHCGEHLDLS